MTKKTTKFDRGIKLKKNDLTTTPLTEEGEVGVDSSDNKLKYRDDSSQKEVVLDSSTQTITNKDIDADNNTVSNIETDNFKAGVVVTSMSGASTDTELPTAKAVYDALEGQNEASEITYDPSGNPETTETNVQGALDDTGTAVGANTTAISDHISDATDAHAGSAITNTPSGNLAATDMQGAVNELQTDVDTRALASDLTDHENEATGAHAGSAISNVPSGNLVATDMQSAVNELQTDIDTRALDSDLTDHENATAAHGATGAVVGTTNTQTVQNKTLDSTNVISGSIETPVRSDVKQDTQANLETYALTATNGQMCFATDTKQMYQVIDNALAPVGSGGGLKNYIENGKAEIDTDGWTVYANTVAGDLPDDFGGTPTGNLTFTRNTTDPLSGDADFKLSTTAANLQGEGVYYEFTLDKVDLAKKMLTTIRKDMSDSGISDGDYRVVLVSSNDVFASDVNIIRATSGEDLQGSTNDNFVVFQTDASDLTYRLCFHRAVTDATATDLYLDELELGPNCASVTTQGDIVVRGSGSGSESITAGTTDITFNEVEDTSGAWDGKTFTAPESGNYFIEGSVDFTTSIARNIYAYVDNAQDLILNNLPASTTGALFPFGGVVYLDKGQTLAIRATTNGGTLDTNVITHWIHIQKVGISGGDLSANSGRAVESHVTMSVDQNIVSTTATKVDFDTIQRDSTSSFDTSNSRFVLPEAGTYQVEANIRFNDSSAGELINAYIYVNGVQQKRIFKDMANTQVSEVISISDTLQDLNKDDYIEIYAGNNSGNYTITANDTETQFKVTKLYSGCSNSDSIATVAARYTSNSGQSMGTSATDLKYEDLDYDTHNAYNIATGEYTVPVTGKYQVNAMYETASVAWTSGNGIRLFVEVNGSVKSQIRDRAWSSISTGFGLNISDTLDLNKGDIIIIQGANGQSASMSSIEEDNVFSIARIK